MTEEAKDGKFIDAPEDNNSLKNDNVNSKVEIEIKRHQQLFELLSDPKRMWRVLLSLFLIIVVLFWGIAFVVIAIKKYYPYNVIETNIQGATTMKSEDKEIIYWLFNTADLWANSGIEVHEGDELTIRASGASCTAIHHLVEASEKNFKCDDNWVGTEGQAKYEARDMLRSEYRINKNCNEGILLMKIVSECVDKVKCHFAEGPVEIIGKERRNLRISKSGFLYFAVNDVVLTNSILDSMYCQYIDTIANHIRIDSETVREIKDEFKSWDGKKRLRTLTNSNSELFSNVDSATIESVSKLGLDLGRYPSQVNKDYHHAHPLVNELVYYKQKSFIDAWYVDNLGSFLIVIERKKQ